MSQDDAMEAGKAPDAPAPALLTIAELVEKFWAHAKSYYQQDGKPTGEQEVIRYALKPLLRMFSALLASEFKPRYLKAVRDEMIRCGSSRRYINASVRRIKRMFNWAVEEELILPEVAGALARVRGLGKGRSEAREKPEVAPVSDEIVEATLPYVSPLVADFIKLMRLSGMRPGEALRMKGSHVDRSADVWVYKPPKHKNLHRNKDRTIYFGPKSQKILAPRIAKAGEDRIFPILASSVRRAIKIACDRAGLKEHWAPNQLRHAAATEIRAKHGLEAAQVILGHSQVKTTQLYAEVNADRGKEIARQVG
jgi:integrase